MPTFTLLSGVDILLLGNQLAATKRKNGTGLSGNHWVYLAVRKSGLRLGFGSIRIMSDNQGVPVAFSDDSMFNFAFKRIRLQDT